MGLYTVLTDPAVDAIVQSHLDAIARAFTEASPSVKAVLITGGFGRGEGSVVVEDPQPRPLNDYDMVVMASGNARALRQPLQSAAQEIGDRIGITVDVGIFEARRLRRMPPTILIYEIRDGHRLLSGDADAIPWPSFAARDLPLEEGTDLLFNRGMSLLRSRVASLDGWPESYPLGTRRQCAIHIQKAIQAWGDAAILAARAYTVSYRERQRAMKALAAADLPPIEAMRERYLIAVDRKLEPQPGDPDGDAAEHLDATIADHEIAFRWFEERRLGIDIDDWTMYRQAAVRRTVLPRATGELLRNPIRHLHMFGIWSKIDALLHSPRESLMGVFPAVLFGREEESRSALRSVGIDARGPAGARRLLEMWH